MKWPLRGEIVVVTSISVFRLSLFWATLVTYVWSCINVITLVKMSEPFNQRYVINCIWRSVRIAAWRHFNITGGLAIPNISPTNFSSYWCQLSTFTNPDSQLPGSPFMQSITEQCVWWCLGHQTSCQPLLIGSDFCQLMTLAFIFARHCDWPQIWYIMRVRSSRPCTWRNNSYICTALIVP